MKKILIVFLFLLIALQAEAVTLTWDKPEDSRVTGYNIYVGLEKPLPECAVVEGADNCSLVIPDLAPHTVYQFMAKSHDANGNLSAPSEYLHWETEAEPVDNIILRLKSPTGLSAED